MKKLLSFDVFKKYFESQYYTENFKTLATKVTPSIIQKVKDANFIVVFMDVCEKLYEKTINF